MTDDNPTGNEPINMAEAASLLLNRVESEDNPEPNQEVNQPETETEEEVEVSATDTEEPISEEPEEALEAVEEDVSEELDEEVASYMVEGFGGVMTKLTKDQAEYINVDEAGPYKPEYYKY